MSFTNMLNALDEFEISTPPHWQAILLQFYPHFSISSAHVSLCDLSSHATNPRAPVMCLQIMGLILAYIALMCIILFAYILVWFLMAVLRLLITFL